MPGLTIQNFSKGWKDDAALDADKIYSLKRMVNADIDYERGSARRRKGYKRYHSANLPGVLKQTYELVDTAGQTRLLAIASDGSNYRLYLVETNENNEIKNYSVTDSHPSGKRLVFDSYDVYPFKTVGNRVFFADDNDWFWTDYSSAKKGAGPYTYECYQVGIDKLDWEQGGQYSEDAPTFTQYTNPQNTTVNTYSELTHKLAQSFTCPTYKLYVGEVTAWVSSAGVPAGTIRARIETDNSGEPSGTLAFDEAVSRWFDIISEVNSGLPDTPLNMKLLSNGWLDANTTYWLVLEGDVNYIADYAAGVDYVRWGRSDANPYANGKASSYNGTTWSDIATSDFHFLVGGSPPTTKIYYRFTFVNDNYGSESEPTEDFMITLWSGAVRMNFSTPDDEQITHIRTYRKKYSTTYSDEYYLVGEALVTDAYFVDVMRDNTLGGQLQTGGDLIAPKHKRLQDADGNLLIPRYLEHWQNRLWAVPNNSKTLYFSKQLEERGATGTASDAIYDYYPADNKWTLDSRIRAIRMLEDRLIVYTSNNNVHVYDGANSPLNPPPDLAHQELIVGDNCYDDRSLVELMGRHIFVTANKQIKAFNGSNILEPISRDNIQQSMDRSGGKYSAVVYKNQYFLAVDTDGDDIMDALYIFDLSGRLPAWREYQYLDRDETALGIYNLFVTNDAKLLAAPAQIDDSVYRIIQLDDGYSDDWSSNESDGIDITMTLQTQFIIPVRRAMWTRFSMKGYYPQGARYGEDFFTGGYYGGDAVIPTLTLYAIGKEAYFVTQSLAPTSSDDVRGHNCGLRLASEECSIRLDSKGDKLDEVREMTLEWRF